MTTDEIKRALKYLATTYVEEIIALKVDLTEAQNKELADKLIAYNKFPALLSVQEDDGAVRPRSAAEIKQDIAKRETALPAIEQLINDHQALVAVQAGISKP